MSDNGPVKDVKRRTAIDAVFRIVERILWPVLLAMLMFAFFMGGRMESPEQKQARIDRALAPVERSIEELKMDIRSHLTLGGHAVMDQRMRTVEGQIQSMQSKMETILDRVEEIHRKIMLTKEPTT